MNELKTKGAIKFTIDGTDVELAEEDVLVATAQTDGFVAESYKNTTVVLDTTLSPELIEEGFARELVSKLQTMRKEAGFEVMDHIRVSLCGNETVAGIASSNQEFIAGKVLADSITAGDMLAVSKEWNVNGENVTIAIEKVN